LSSRSKQNVPITFSALINDTTGTLIASNYVDPATKIAVIFGTGCNAAYMETVENIPKMKGLGLPDKQEMAINCEWGAFDSFEHAYLRESENFALISFAGGRTTKLTFCFRRVFPSSQPGPSTILSSTRLRTSPKSRSVASLFGLEQLESSTSS